MMIPIIYCLKRNDYETYYFLISLFIHVFFSAKAQISTNEEPISFQEKTVFRSPSQDIRTMPALNMNIIEQEDVSDEANGIPPRFGYPHKVSFNMQNSGYWQELSNGDKLWQLTVRCSQALSINLLYDKFWLPEGSKFFIYTTDRKHSIGAFTSVNNKGDRSNVQGFATGLLYGDEITLEYYQPRQVNEQAIISVAYVVQGYRYIQLPWGTRNLGSSGSCQVNVNCPEGQGWQQEKNAVALILVNGNRYCTGSLINTTANDNRPLFLTADHCLGGWGNNYVKYDAINNSNLSHWSFYWHYEAPGCNTTSTEPPILSTSGATVVSNNSVSDFALLRLTEDPRNRQGVTPYYLGWDRSGNSGTGGVGIHHPSGDVKKIATLNNPPNNNWNGNTNFWSHYWNETPNGYSVTEGGSSGSPLINSNHHVIGQLYGGSDINCSAPEQDIAAYGKFSVSWTGNGATDSRRRLRDWLDPQGTNPQTLEGKELSSSPPYITGPSEFCDNAIYKIANLPTGTTVQWSTSM
ncbi:trypsin-like serine peptidase [Tannerella forsythia]